MRLRAALGLILVAITSMCDAEPHAPPDPLGRVGFDQHLAQQVPLDASFHDESGKRVRLADYFGTRPVILALAYYDCANLCTLVLNGVIEGLRRVDFRPGIEFDVVAVSINPNDTPALASDKKAAYLAYYGHPASDQGWHFLTGEESSITRLADAVGFRYFYDEKQKQYAHAAGITMLTPQGKIARYFYGIQFAPQDLRLGLMDASAERIGSAADRLMLLCFHYDPRTGQYGLLIQSWMQTLALATVIGLGGFVFLALRRERRSRKSPVR
jgi:protein SCO1